MQAGFGGRADTRAHVADYIAGMTDRFAARARAADRPPAAALTAPLPRPAWLVLLGGVSAALHVGKLPPALAGAARALGISLVAGRLPAVAGAARRHDARPAGRPGGRQHRSPAHDGAGPVLTGSPASRAAAAHARPAAGLRALEGLGFLLGALPAPALIRRLVPNRTPERDARPVEHLHAGRHGLALLVGPAWIALGRLAGLVVAAGAFSLVMAAWLALVLPQGSAGAHLVDVGNAHAADIGRARALAGGARVRRLLVAVAGGDRLPADDLPRGRLAPAWAVATTLAAAVNIIGNVASGRLLQRGVRRRACCIGFLAMGIGGVLAFAPWTGEGAAGARALCCATPGVLGPVSASAASCRARCSRWPCASRPGPEARSRPRSAGCSSGRPSASSPARRWWRGSPPAAARAPAAGSGAGT
jgi:CP family cyanate transporter-like MFS transporter